VQAGGGAHSAQCEVFRILFDIASHDNTMKTDATTYLKKYVRSGPAMRRRKKTWVIFCMIRKTMPERLPRIVWR